MSLKQIAQNPSLLANLLGFAANTGAALINEQDWFEKDSLVEKIPYAKIVAWFIKKSVVIEDVDKAFNHAYAMAYFLCFSQGIKRYKVFLKGVDLVEIKTGKQSEYFFPLGNGDLIDTDIFHHYEKKYENLLNSCQVADKAKGTVLNYIRWNLKIIFHELLEDRPLVYKTLCEELDKTSFLLRNDKLRITQYYQEQKNFYLSPVMGDEQGMTLQDVYIEPGYRIHKNCIGENKVNENFKESEYTDPERNSVHVFVEPKTNVYTTIHELLGDFIFDSPIKDEIKYPDTTTLVLLGYPGQGKTSCIRRLLFDLIGDPGNSLTSIYHLPLRSIENVRNFCDAPFEVIEEHMKEKNLPDYYIQRVARNGIIILEGLDELAIQSGTKEKTIDEVVKELLRVQENRPGLKLIITSRLGYLNCEQFIKKNLLILQLKEFSSRQQQHWLSKYKMFYPGCRISKKDIQEYNKEDNHLKELINQPILLHMVVTSGLKASKDTNRAKLYETLFNSLIERKWADKKQIGILGELKPEDLREIVQDIALAIFHRGRNCIQKKEVEELEAVRRNIAQKLGFDKLGGTLKGVMVSFYFQEVEQKEGNGSFNYGIEFLHKSLSEYMAAEKIWKEIKVFTEQRSSKRRYTIDSLKEALELLNQLFAPKLLTREIRDYIWEIMENDNEFEQKKLSERLSYFFPDLLQKEFLWEYDAEKHDFPVKRALHTFYGYWTVVSKLALQTKMNYLGEEQLPDFVRLLKSCLVMSHPLLSLTFQILSKANLSRANLYGANLSGADLSEAKLSEAKLSEAKLFRADLSEADLSEADLSEAKLSGADLSRAKLHGAKLHGANLSEANLSKANLSEAKLYGAKLYRADLNNSLIDQDNYNFLKKQRVNLAGVKVII
ncbi:MAG: pentapeptide repeat-containing protein [Mangrovibacterium sp.]